MTPSQKNPSVLIHGVWALVAAVTFGVGYFASAPSAAETQRRNGGDESLSSAGQTSADRNSGGDAGLGDGRPHGALLTGAEAKARIFQCLSEPDRIERMRLLCALLPLVTKENWREVEDAFTRQQSKEFRIAPWERELMIERLGQVLGGEAVDEALAAGDKSKKGRAATLLRGWAGADPKQAAAWFDTQKPEVQKILLGEFLAGLALGEPKRAMEVMLRYGTEEKETYMPWLVSNTIQREGFQGTEKMFGAMMADPTVDEDARRQAFRALAIRRLDVAKLLGQPVDNLDWLDGYLRPESPVGPHVADMIVRDAAQRDALGTAKWLDERDARLSPDQQMPAYLAVAQSLLNSSPDQFVAWMGQHAAHPQYDAMVKATVGGLAKQGKAEQAQQLIGTVRDEALRTKLQASLAKQSQRSEGIRVEGRDGFIRSAADPQARPIDVRGLPKGIEVEDPHNPGRTIIVP